MNGPMRNGRVQASGARRTDTVGAATVTNPRLTTDAMPHGAIRRIPIPPRHRLTVSAPPRNATTKSGMIPIPRTRAELPDTAKPSRPTPRRVPRAAITNRQDWETKQLPDRQAQRPTLDRTIVPVRRGTPRRSEAGRSRLLFPAPRPSRLRRPRPIIRRRPAKPPAPSKPQYRPQTHPRPRSSRPRLPQVWAWKPFWGWSDC